MMKEVVSLAIILGFIANVLWVAHPNTTSYTIAFVASLAALSPFVLGYRYWSSRAERGSVKEELPLVESAADTRARVAWTGSRTDVEERGLLGVETEVEA